MGGNKSLGLYDMVSITFNSSTLPPSFPLSFLIIDTPVHILRLVLESSVNLKIINTTFEADLSVILYNNSTLTASSNSVINTSIILGIGINLINK